MSYSTSTQYSIINVPEYGQVSIADSQLQLLHIQEDDKMSSFVAVEDILETERSGSPINRATYMLLHGR